MAEPEKAPDVRALVKELIAEKPAVVKIGGEDFDVGRIPPLTIGDKRRLYKDHGVNLSNAGRFTPEEEFQYALYLVRRVRPATTEAELEAADLTALAHIAVQMLRVEGSFSRPTSASSPTSPGTTAGTPEASTG